MTDDDRSDKSHEPTERRLAKSREKGEIARSPDLLAAVAYAGLLIAAAALGPQMARETGSALMAFLDQPDMIARTLFAEGAVEQSGRRMASAVAPLLPLILVPACLVITTLIATRGLTFTASKLAPKLDRLSPVANAKNKYGRRGLFEFAKSFAKLLIYGGCLGIFLAADIERIAASLFTGPWDVATLLGKQLTGFLAVVVAIAALIGWIDWLWQHREHLRRNRMSMEDLREEAKESEGDPHVKHQRRARGQEIALRQVAQEVPKADVLIVNPTHYAVALKWSRAPGTAPVCTAKGQDQIALRMREIAAEHKVPIHSDAPTARALHAGVDIGEEIDSAHYRAVAAAIRFADAIRGKARKEREWTERL